MKKQIYTAIKVTSIGLVSATLAFELSNLALSLPVQVPNLIIGFGRFVLISHALEGAIAAIYAPSRQQRSLPYSFYTFFVGTVGLMELFDIEPFQLNASVNNKGKIG
ncbi:MAG: hypothetical protein AAF215_11790 [Cyanobacteria bacterium P01_A01_bin.123]